MPDRSLLTNYVVLTPGIPFPTTEKDVTTIEKLVNDDIQVSFLPRLILPLTHYTFHSPVGCKALFQRFYSGLGALHP